MAEEPDRIRDEIEDTRAELARDVDRLADKTSPGRVAQRRWTAVKEKVMGTPRHAAGGSRPMADTTRSAVGTVQDAASRAGDKVSETASRAGDKAGETAQDVADTVREAPRKVARQTQGNPIAAGVIAFGVGLLAASLIPTTEAEKRAGQQLRENIDELPDEVREPLRESAQQLKDDVSGTVQDAAYQVKDTAAAAARTTGQEAKESAKDAAEETRRAAR
jgi:hypothetical protein